MSTGGELAQRQYIIELEKKIRALNSKNKNPTLDANLSDTTTDQTQQSTLEADHSALVTQDHENHALGYTAPDGPFDLETETQSHSRHSETAVIRPELNSHGLESSSLRFPSTSAADIGSDQSLYLSSALSPQRSELQSPAPLSVEQGFASARFWGETCKLLGSHNHLQSIGERIQIHKPKRFRGTSEGRAISSPEYLLPVRSTADSLLQLYWTDILPFFPFVHRPSFQERYEQLWVSDSPPPDDGFHCLLNIIFAISSRVSGKTSLKAREASSTSFIARARELLQFDFLSPGTLETVQTWLLMAQYLQSANEPWPCWIAVGTAVRIAQGIGIHQGGSDITTWSQRDQEMARRLWHGCALMDRIIAGTLGLRSTAHELAMDPVPLPTAIDDEYLSAIPNVYGKQPLSRPSLQAFFISTTRLFDILSDVMDRFYTDSRRSDAVASTIHTTNEDLNLKGLVEAEARLNGYWEHLPSSLKSSLPAPASVGGRRELVLQASVLRCRFLFTKLLIYRPLLARLLDLTDDSVNQNNRQDDSVGSSILQSSAAICVRSAMELTNILCDNLIENSE
ncbi:hypothetical protein PV10_04654 [Exophiala mesophila]|uniref:Xylanolytic transcriptional activator regulatory domain-containing protein n=1 Tax=Exophiala mesophila TaxID=212818 RepID=A0A0D1XYY8_EXOME|nr:uncharacterized protein PV10_04654 [Exophiala mesophila]KIV93441.1 hypothetical protein PV10_04654 [Exophiala mesophila]